MIYTKMTINGTEYRNMTNIGISKTTSDHNASSSFTTRFSNTGGQYSNTFNLNDEVIIYAEKDVPDPTIKIFAGVIEEINHSGRGENEEIEISGRDYTAILQDVTTGAAVYRNKEILNILLDLMSNNVPFITTNHTNLTGVTLERITFNQMNMFDAIIRLCKLSGFYFYVDEDKDLHFNPKNSISSGVTLDNTNTLSINLRNQDRDIYNDVKVFGRRILTGTNEKFVADGGSVFTLSSKPHNSMVFKNDLIQKYGGVVGIADPANTTNLNWLVDFDKSQIIFVSGIQAGDNIPTSGADIISIDYDRSTPVLKFKQDTPSIFAYGKKTKVIVDKNIQSFAEANDEATSFLDDHKDPVIEGSIKVKGVLNVIPGNTIQINLPRQNQSNQTYTIISAKYNFNKENNLSEKVLSIKINQKIFDLTDTIKEIILNQKKLETSDLDANLTTVKQSTEGVYLNNHWELWGKSGTNFVFRFHLQGNDVFESPHAVLGPWELGSTLIKSGGQF